MPGPETSVEFLAVRQGAIEWGLEASCVERIAQGSDWGAPLPIDVAACLGLPRSEHDRERVIAVPSEGRGIALWAGRGIRLRSHRRSEVLPLPALVFASPWTRKALRGLVLPEGEYPLFVIDVGELAALVGAKEATLAYRGEQSC